MKNIYLGIVLLIIFCFNGLYMLSLFPIFLILSGSSWIQNQFKKIKGPLIIQITLAGTFSGVLTESIAIFDNWVSYPIQKSLFSQDPVTDLVVALVYYIALIIFWYFVLVRYNYSTLKIFMIGGVYGGIFSEQLGAVLLSFNILAWTYAFLVHGSIIAISYVLIKHKLRVLQKKDSYLSYVLPVVVYGLALLITAFWMKLLGV